MESEIDLKHKIKIKRKLRSLLRYVLCFQNLVLIYKIFNNYEIIELFDTVRTVPVSVRVKTSGEIFCAFSHQQMTHGCAGLHYLEVEKVEKKVVKKVEKEIEKKN